MGVTHGGRQLDTSAATIDRLPEIRAAVGDDVEVIADGGVVRGSLVVKALALGASSVAVGKGTLYSLAAGGQDGVERMFAILKRELSITMGLMGIKSIDELKARGPELVRPRRGVDWNLVDSRMKGKIRKYLFLNA